MDEHGAVLLFDDLGAWTKRALDLRLPAEITRAQRHGRPLSLVMVSLDGFAEAGRCRGPEWSHAVLREVTQRVLGAVRAHADVVVRDGDEFLLVLPDADLGAAEVVAATVREAVGGPFSDASGDPVRLRVATGVGAWTPGMPAHVLVAAAAAALGGATVEPG